MNSSKELVCLVSGLSDASLRLAGLVNLCHMHHKIPYTVCLAVDLGSEGLFDTSTRVSQFIGKYLDWIVTGYVCWPAC